MLLRLTWFVVYTRMLVIQFQMNPLKCKWGLGIRHLLLCSAVRTRTREMIEEAIFNEQNADCRLFKHTEEFPRNN